MAERDDVSRVLAACGSCHSVYAAREWPDGTIQPIGRERCSCGSSEFVLTDDSVGEHTD